MKSRPKGLHDEGLSKSTPSHTTGPGLPTGPPSTTIPEADRVPTADKETIMEVLTPEYARTLAMSVWLRELYRERLVSPKNVVWIASNGDILVGVSQTSAFDPAVDYVAAGTVEQYLN